MMRSGNMIHPRFMIHYWSVESHGCTQLYSCCVFVPQTVIREVWSDNTKEQGEKTVSCCYWHCQVHMGHSRNVYTQTRTKVQILLQVNLIAVSLSLGKLNSLWHIQSLLNGHFGNMITT